MSQVWKNDKVIPITLIKIAEEFKKDEWPEEELVKVTGVSKGKGFQGVVKRHGFSGGPKTHGQKNRHRAPGSIGDTAKQRVVLGRKMAGRMGNKQVTVRNLKIVSIDQENKIMALKGAVPGRRNTKLKIQKL